ncbi:MAG: heme d1 biosynthesis radical SAM protein NirJ [Gammaproteobacteria bacterium]|nr:heme d1 biosynthesis radical SAM protein NirJ [Gammaproteobacteria bacterium]MCP4089084.1 heme d1 biosynthesis radical SAM protein NirJ [Gammaproteobacteria bacterium]MCP4276891.1 heme d1 biosynthesis radical SAM protein NirJ [Gammaproteobacteria bacterium]MCP4830734.1 heme d1 biosynthesis radical SAM protein NirJ [Gammaproteobacteria bacterium]MCP4928842.1 heme d1 biosynthesis radical SAM protein NirJ [Gammaproteobacteria bacterium]
MLRVTEYLSLLQSNDPLPPARKPKGPVVIWNLIRRCNLACKHCYSISADTDFPGELSTNEVYAVMDDLKAYGVPVLILSGGEPLLRPDIYDIARRAKAMGFYTALSSNGTLIDEEHARQIADIDFEYVGISLDGIGKVHDQFRRKEGAYDNALNAIRLLKKRHVKTGLRFTLTEDNREHFEPVMDLTRSEGVDKFYLSHLNYGGRGNRNRKDDVVHKATRDAVTFFIERAWEDVQQGRKIDYVSGNNDADGVFLLFWVRKNFPEQAERMETVLKNWGGNGSGKTVANIDNIGNVHPDTFWWQYSIGSIKERPFSDIWSDTSNALMAGLKQEPRQLKGRCGACQYLNICGGNARIRPYQLTGDPWEEDPACYLNDEEIGVEMPEERAPVQPYNRSKDLHYKKSPDQL